MLGFVFSNCITIFFNLVSKYVFFTRLLTLGILPSISVTLVLKSVFFLTKLLTSGILFSTAINSQLVAKPVTLGILPSILVTLVFKTVFFLTKLLISSIFCLFY